MIYLELFIGFLIVGLFSFGGAYAAIPLIRDVVLLFGWIDEEVLTNMIAVSESTPGPIMVNLATYVGCSQAGILGGIISTFAVVLPAFFIILLITVVLKKMLENKYVDDDNRSFLATDCSTMQMLEYKAQSDIASHLGFADDAASFGERADAIGQAINTFLWDAADKCYYNVDRATGELFKRVSYNSFWPLYAGLASQEDGAEMIRRYLISEDHMLSPYGLRSLSASDQDYNNENIIVPFSNWQGPIWIPALVVYAGGMDNYGFHEELKPIVLKTARMLLADIAKFDTMHENYHAETGEGLAPAPTYVDENGKFIGFISWNLCTEYLLANCLK